MLTIDSVLTVLLELYGADGATNIKHASSLPLQERPAVPGSKSDKNFISPARLPRKKFVVTKSEKETTESGNELVPQEAQDDSRPKRNESKSKEKSDDDGDDEEEKSSGSKLRENLGGVADAAASAEAADLNDSGHRSSDDETDGGRRSPKKFDAESPDSTFVSVVTIPDPGESHTDDEIGEKVAVVTVPGNFLGGVANIGFEAEEEESDGGRGRGSPLNDSFDAGYRRNRNLSDVNIRYWIIFKLMRLMVCEVPGLSPVLALTIDIH